MIEEQDRPLTVSDVTRQVKKVLEGRFPRLWVVGEISNFKRATSGHWYFSLKDADSQIRCNMWRSYNGTVRFQPRDGTEVLISGSMNVYAPRGEYSLMVERMEEVGMGRLRQEFERLKRKLHGEGLFDKAHKKPLPVLPRKIGVVTSRTGAAVRDILRVLKERFPGLHVVIYPARVQGTGAAEEIAAGIQYLDVQGDYDALIVGRGGGSEEDLWAFNEEVVARAIFAAKTPIISAVGHEVDWTIADYVADVRAATPSNAAELVVRSLAEYQQAIHLRLRDMERGMQRRLLALRNRINVSESHPIFIAVRSRINDVQRRLAELDYQMQTAIMGRLQDRQARLVRASDRIHPQRLSQYWRELAQRLARARQDMDDHSERRLRDRAQRVAMLTARLEDLSPLKTLARGFAAVYKSDGRLVRRPKDVSFGEVLRIKLAEGDVRARVIQDDEAAEQTSLF